MNDVGFYVMAIQHKPLFHDLTEKKNYGDETTTTVKLKSNSDDEKMEHFFIYIYICEYFCAALNYHFRLSDFN